MPATKEEPVIKAVKARPHFRLRLAGGILKALFTTSPFKATEVLVAPDGEIVVRPAEPARD